MSDFHLRDVPPSSRIVWDARFVHHGTSSKANSNLRRQESSTSSSGETTSNIDTSSASTTSAADAKPTMINAPAQIGLIMPNPGSNVYTGVEYRMGYVDPGPAPRVDGVLRVITPLLTYPNHTTDVFPEVGTVDADPQLHQNTVGWCSVNLAAPPYTFPLLFEKSGWYQFVINTTWGRPTITGDDLSTNCSTPIRQQYTFFGTKAFSVSPSPTTGGLIKAAPAFTVWTDLTWRTPGELPLDTRRDTTEKKVIVGLSIAGVFVAIGTIVATMWLVRRRRRAARELLAMSRLPPREQAELLNRPLPVLPLQSLGGHPGMNYAQQLPPTANGYQYLPVGQWQKQGGGDYRHRY